MDSLEPKKLVTIRILQILENYTDSQHLLKQEEIIKKLSADYGLEVERKAIGRNISFLQEAGYEIITTKKGTYLTGRLFEDSELRLLSDSVLASQHISVKHSKDLIEKLSKLSNKYFKSHIKNAYSVKDWSKSENITLFYNIDIVDEAIEKKVKIKFNYNKYGMDKKLHRSATHIVSPYQLILHNQHYFLMAHNEKWKDISYFRVDRITDIVLLEDEKATLLHNVEGYENGIDYKKFSSALPYMFADKPQEVTFLVDGEWMIDHLVDWFGFNFRIKKQEDKILITVKASLTAMEYWAMQYLNNVEVLTPQSLREQIKTNLEKATKKYEN